MAMSSTGRKDAFAAVYMRYFKAVYSYYFKMLGGNISESEELTQDLFLKLYRLRESYDSKWSFKTWMWSSARNLLIDRWRKKQMKHLEDMTAYNQSIDDIVEDSNDGPLEELVKRTDREFLHDSLSKLKPHYKEAMILWIEEVGFIDMASIMGRSEQACKNLVQRAKRDLLKEISGSISEGEVYERTI
jgi:RNA polymerase sigma-70 factor (ECF subfamily)